MKVLSARHPWRRGSAGFGLVEVIVTVFIVALAVLAIGRLVLESSRSTTESKARTEALVLAEEKLEALRDYALAVDYDALTSECEEAPLEGSSAAFTRCWEVDSSDASLFAVTVTVSWQGLRQDPDATEAPAAALTHTVSLSGRLLREEPVMQGKKLAVLEAGPNPSTATPIDPEGQDERRVIVELVPVADFAGDLPPEYVAEYDYVYIYQILVYGNLDKADLLEGEGFDATIESIDGISNTSYTPFCAIATNRLKYQCTVYYLSFYDGWTGSVTWIAAKSDDLVCEPTAAHPAVSRVEVSASAPNRKTAYLDNVLFDTEVNVLVASAKTGC
ncbi:MAG: type IV pilus modification PilV family protein [Haliea sp.]